MIFIVFANSFLTQSDRQNYKTIYKRNIVLETFKDFFTDIQYHSNTGLHENIISETNMMKTGDRYSSNDYIVAKYKNINFSSSDVEIEEKHKDSDGNTHYTTIFKGQWFIFDFNKKFKANVQICEKNFYGATRGGLFSTKTYHRIKMEDIEFNKIFKVYAENEFDAFYILTPNTMERIKELNRKITGNLLFCFIDNKMHVGIHNDKDLFEPNIYKKIDLKKEKEKILNEIKIITEFVDILDLDNDLFKRSI